jgi:hypothetical protein
MRPVPEWNSPTADEFRRTIIPGGRPAVLRSIAADWPLVVAAKNDPGRCAAILAANATEEPVEVLRADPGEEGRFHYRPDGRSLNFMRGQATLPAFLSALWDQSQLERPYALAVQGLRACGHVRGFNERHPMPLVPPGVEPRLWIGNASKVAAHKDPIDNVAVVAAGRRRFTLFPSCCEPDLYMGSDHPTPAGTPVSMVDVTAPDLDRFPHFAAALGVAEQADLAPGDAIFIPKDWFHHVEALERFNMLVNYWWDASTNSARAGEK